jgi:hypothetical protein
LFKTYLLRFFFHGFWRGFIDIHQMPLCDLSVVNLANTHVFDANIYG